MLGCWPGEPLGWACCDLAGLVAAHRRAAWGRCLVAAWGAWGANSVLNRAWLARLPGGPGRRRWFAASLCAFQGPEMAAWLAYGLRLGL